MRFITALAAFVTAVSASPLPSTLFSRATCSSLTPHPVTVGSSTVQLTGPFKLSVSNADKLEGNYASAGGANKYPYVIFGVKASSANKRGADFYLNAAKNLVIIQDGVIYHTYESGAGDNSGHVAISANAAVANKTVCTISSACALSCNVGTYNYNYLASPAYQPDWRIAGAAGANHPSNIAFTPLVVPSS